MLPLTKGLSRNIHLQQERIYTKNKLNCTQLYFVIILSEMLIRSGFFSFCMCPFRVLGVSFVYNLAGLICNELSLSFRVLVCKEGEPILYVYLLSKEFFQISNFNIQGYNLELTILDQRWKLCHFLLNFLSCSLNN